MSLWGNKDQANNTPAHLSAENKGKVYFVDQTEAGVDTNREKGLKTPGWNLYDTHEAAGGATRHRVETLVSLKETAAIAGDSGAAVVLATAMVANTEYTIVDAGNTDFTAVGAANSGIGTTFTANGAATGTGTVSPTEDDVVADS